MKELIFTALPITAQRALAVGILNHVVDAMNRKILPYRWRTTLRSRAGSAAGDSGH